jgi:maleylpyruvate isomerase
LIKLHHNVNSSASFRVRIALKLKSIPYVSIPHDLDTLTQGDASYLELNPQGMLPTIEHDLIVITQSLAILDYLDELFPLPPLLPSDALGRVRVRSLFEMVAADPHPLTTRRVGRQLKRLGHSQSEFLTWQRHWISEGFDTVELCLSQSRDTGKFCHGNSPTLADIAVVAQAASARRLGVDLARWPVLQKIFQFCLEEPAFAAAHREGGTS